MDILTNKIQQYCLYFMQCINKAQSKAPITTKLLQDLQKYSQKQLKQQYIQKELQSIYNILKSATLFLNNQQSRNYLKSFCSFLKNLENQLIKKLGETFDLQISQINSNQQNIQKQNTELKFFCRQKFLPHMKKKAQQEIESYFKHNFLQAEYYYQKYKNEQSHKGWLIQPVIYNLLEPYKNHINLKKYINLFILIQEGKYEKQQIQDLNKKNKELFNRFNDFSKKDLRQFIINKEYQVVVKLNLNNYRINIDENTTVEDLIEIIEERIGYQLDDLNVNSSDIDFENTEKTVKCFFKNKYITYIQLQDNKFLKFQYKCENYRIKNQEVQITKFITSHKSKNPNISLQLFALSGHPFNSKLFNPQQSIVVQQKIMPTPLKQFLERIQFNNQRKLRHSDIIRIEKQPIERNDLSLFDWLYKVEARNLRSNYEFLEFLNKQDIDGMDYKTFLVLVMQSYPDYRQEVLFNCVRFGIALPYIYQFPSGDAMRYKCKLDPFQTIRLKNEFHLISVGSNCSMGKSTLLNKVFGTNFIVGRQTMIFGGIDVVTYYKQNLDTIKCNVFDVHQSYYLQRQNLKFLKDSINSQKVIFLIQVFNNEDAIRIEEEILKQWKPMKMIILYRDVKKNTVLPSSNNIRQVYGIPNLKQLDSNYFIQQFSNTICSIVSKISSNSFSQNIKYSDKINQLLNHKYDILVSYSFKLSYLKIMEYELGINKLQQMPQTISLIRSIIRNNSRNQISKTLLLMKIRGFQQENIFFYFKQEIKQIPQTYFTISSLQIMDKHHSFIKQSSIIFQKLKFNPYTVVILGSSYQGKSTLLNYLFNSEFENLYPTKGLNFRLIPSDNANYIGILDTEGILSINKQLKNQIQQDKMYSILMMSISNTIIFNSLLKLKQSQKNLFFMSLYGLKRLGLISKRFFNRPQIIFILRDQILRIKDQQRQAILFQSELSKFCQSTDLKFQDLIEYNNDNFIKIEYPYDESKRYSQKCLKNIYKKIKNRILSFQDKFFSEQIQFEDHQKRNYNQWFKLVLRNQHILRKYKQFYMVDSINQLIYWKDIQYLIEVFKQEYIIMANNQNKNECEEYFKNIKKQKLEKKIFKSCQQSINEFQIIQGLKMINSDSIQQLKQMLKQWANIEQIDNKYHIINIKDILQTKIKVLIDIITSFNTHLKQIQYRIQKAAKIITQYTQFCATIVQNISKSSEQKLEISPIEYHIRQFKLELNKYDRNIKQFELESKFSIVQKVFSLYLLLSHKNNIYFTSQSIQQCEGLIKKFNKKYPAQINLNKILIFLDRFFVLKEYQFQGIIFTQNQLTQVSIKLKQVYYQFTDKLTKTIKQQSYKIVQLYLKSKIFLIKKFSQKTSQSHIFGEIIIQPFFLIYYYYINNDTITAQNKLMQSISSIQSKNQEELKEYLKTIQSDTKNAIYVADIIIKNFQIQIQKVISNQFIKQLSKLTKLPPNQFYKNCEQYYFRDNSIQVGDLMDYILLNTEKKLQEKFERDFLYNYNQINLKFKYNFKEDYLRKWVQNIEKLFQNCLTIFKNIKFREKFSIFSKTITQQSKNITLIETFKNMNLNFFKVYFSSQQNIEDVLSNISKLLDVDIYNLSNPNLMQNLQNLSFNFNFLSLLYEHNSKKLEIINPLRFYSTLLSNLIQNQIKIQKVIPVLLHPKIQQLKKVLFQNSKGCQQKCPYCLAKCTNVQENHQIHKTNYHRFQAFSGIYRYIKIGNQLSDKLFSFEVCNSQNNIKRNQYSSIFPKQLYSPAKQTFQGIIKQSNNNIEIHLKWWTDEDLDLHCICPCTTQKSESRHVHYMNKKCKKCPPNRKTRLTVDMQCFANNPGKDYLEEIICLQNPNEQGEIKCWVLYYKKHQNQECRFQVTIKRQSQPYLNEVFRGSLKNAKQIYQIEPIKVTNCKKIKSDSISFKEHNKKFDRNWEYEISYTEEQNKKNFDLYWNGWKNISSLLSKHWGVEDYTEGNQINVNRILE